MHFDRYDEWLSSGRCVLSVSMTNRYFPKGRFRMRYRDLLGCNIVSLSVCFRCIQGKLVRFKTISQTPEVIIHIGIQMNDII